MKNYRLPILALGAMAIALGGLAGPAYAQPAQQPQAAEQAAPSFSDAQLKSFVTAALEVQRINNDYVPKMQNAEGREQQMAVRKEATQRMTQAIKDEGLTIQEYKQISNAAQKNPDVAERLQKHLEEQGAVPGAKQQGSGAQQPGK